MEPEYPLTQSRLKAEMFADGANLRHIEGKPLQLRAQKRAIQVTVRLAIENTLGNLMFDHPFPNLRDRVKACRQALLDSATSLGHTDIGERLTTDLEYLSKLAKMVRTLFLHDFILISC
jgi:hypothetical protein